MVEDGVNPELLGKYGHALHIWDMRSRRHVETLDPGAEQQMVLELRPAHDPRTSYGFVGVVVSLADLSASVWQSHPDNGRWGVRKIIEIPAEPADASALPPALQPFGAVPPLITDINLSLDDRCLYVSCWGTGEFRQYDVSDPFNPRLTGSVRLGGIVSKDELNGGPQMVEISRDGRRAYVTNFLYASWDAQFYPAGVRGWLAKLDCNPEGGLALDPNFFVQFPEGERPHQLHLEGGDASSDSSCFP
jgi:methanethiol oxidase